MASTTVSTACCLQFRAVPRASRQPGFLCSHQVKSKRPDSQIARAQWQQVTDPQSGQAYYWNTESNQTSWTLPAGAVLANSVGTAASTISGTEQSAAQPASRDNLRTPEELLVTLQAAYQADTAGGMHFWEVARSLRGNGVFEEPFFAFLQRQVATAPNADARLELEQLQARLSNPLLRQAAPFEF